MISFILKLIELPGTWYNRHQVRKNATFIGKAQILRHAHIRPFRGSTAKDIIIGNDFSFFPEQFVHRIKGKLQSESIVKLVLIVKFCALTLSALGTM